MSIIDIMFNNIIYRFQKEKYFSPDTAAGFSSALYRIAFEEWDRKSFYSVSNPNVITFMSITAGEALWKINEDNGSAKKGDILVFGNDTYFELSVNKPIKLYVMCIPGHMKNMLNQYHLKGAMHFQVMQDYKYYSNLCADMLNMAVSETLIKQQLCNNYLQMLLQIMRNETTNQANNKNKSGDVLINNACNFIEANLDKLKGIQEIINYCNCSNEHLSRLFKKEKGMPLLKYLRQRQMILAEQLIRNNKFKLQDAAEYFGFSDAYSFAKAFHKARGFSPGRCRTGKNHTINTSP